MLLEFAGFRDFRNLEEVGVHFSPGLNVLWGENAQGKSNILEGVYFFARGRSFRGAKEKTMIRTDTAGAEMKIVCRAEKDVYPTVMEVIIPRTGNRTITRSGAEISVREMLGTFRAVLFCPSHLELVAGAPEDRRQFLDIALAQISRSYLSALGVYAKTLRERNAMIRQAQDEVPAGEMWPVFAEQLARAGAYLTHARRTYVALLERETAARFDEMTGGRETPAFRYVSTALGREPGDEIDGDLFPAKIPEQTFNALYAALTRNTAREIAAGTTLYGPHRDDLDIMLNEHPARQYASQGQTRSIALAMKLSEGAISRRTTGEEPVYLLDDVFSELDVNRRDYLLSSLGDRQVILTSCEPEATLDALSPATFFRVSGGQVGAYEPGTSREGKEEPRGESAAEPTQSVTTQTPEGVNETRGGL